MIVNELKSIKGFLIIFGFVIVWLLSLSSEKYRSQTATNITQESASKSTVIIKDLSVFEDVKVDVNKHNINFTVLVTGDVNLGRSVNYQSFNLNDFKYPFRPLAGILKEADLTIVNLESPLINDCPKTNEGMRFCGNSKSVEGLVEAGVDIASLANNHASDFGKLGLLDTKKALVDNNILPIEHGKSVQTTVKGNKIAVIGYDLIWHGIDEEKLKKDIKAAKQSSDILIAMLHWGNEYTLRLTQRQKRIAHLLIDNGVDLVVGNHPHWVQPIENYKDKLIVYSHGNFIFDQLWSETTREGIIGKYLFSGGKFVDAEFIPIWINNNFQPIKAGGERSEKILSKTKKNNS